MAALGDGVTAEYDGYHLVLVADGTKTLYLEPRVFDALLRYVITPAGEGGPSWSASHLVDVLDMGSKL